MSEGGDWLPNLMLLDDYDGDWQRYIDAVYAAFVEDFVTSPLASFAGNRVALKRHPLREGRETTFWHFTTEGPAEDERLPDVRRCERIRWPRAIMEADESLVRRWTNRRGDDTRILLALGDFSYVVVLADRGDYVLPWTAYIVEREHRRAKLRKEFEESQKS